MKKGLLLLGDIFILYSSLALTLWIRYGYLDQNLWSRHLLPFSIIFAIWLIVFFINGLYEFKKVRVDFSFYSNLLQNLGINAALAIVFFYLFSDDFGQMRPQTILLILMVVYATLFFIWRKSFYKLISSRSLGNNLALIGLNDESLALAEEIINKPQLGYQLKLIINPDFVPVPEKFQIIPISKNINDLKNEFLKHKIQTVVVVNNPKYAAEVSRYLFENINLKIQYYNLTNFYEKIIGKIPLMLLEKNWFLENFNSRSKNGFEIAKRFIDLFFAFFFGLISLILIPFIAVAIKLESKGKIIYQQERVGLNNKKFKVYKFRTMQENAEQNGAVWASINDARVTRIGKLLRRTRLDEIPQFLNIIIGNMSFVGPRPERPEFVEQLRQEIPFYNERHLIKPGLTGWAQINYPYGASVADAKEKLQYDLFYIKNQSVALDVSIILKTINAMFNIALGR
jgi:exopolysaccharide biosynthesis polyprenyl glycosylphosphotransferase